MNVLLLSVMHFLHKQLPMFFRIIVGPRPDVVHRNSAVKSYLTSAIGIGLAKSMLDVIKLNKGDLPESILQRERAERAELILYSHIIHFRFWHSS